MFQTKHQLARKRNRVEGKLGKKFLKSNFAVWKTHPIFPGETREGIHALNALALLGVAGVAVRAAVRMIRAANTGSIWTTTILTVSDV